MKIEERNGKVYISCGPPETKPVGDGWMECIKCGHRWKPKVEAVSDEGE